MPFDRPTLTVIVDRVTGDFQSRITGATTLLRNSVLRVFSKVIGGSVHLLYGYLDYQYKQIFIMTADEYGLISHGNEYGIDRNEAIKAEGDADGTGTNGTVIPAGTEFQADDGQVYTSDEAETIAAGVFTVNLTASAAGQAGNQDAASVLTFVSPIVGADSTVTVDSDELSNGTDEEDVEDWRSRLLTRKRQPPHGGSETDYEQWAFEVSGVTRVWVFPSYMGAGTVGIAFVRDDDVDLIPSNTEMEAVYDYIVSHTDPSTGKTVGIPVTAEPGFFMVGYNDGQTFAQKAVDLSIGIYPNSTANQTAIQTKLEDALELYGGPGETVYISDLYSVLTEVADLERLRIDSPAADITATQQEVHVSGTITFSAY